MSNAMSFEFSGADELLKKLKKAASHEDVTDAVKINTAELARNAIRSTPVDTGFLKRSITPEVTGLVGRVRVGAEYGAYVELGTRFMAAQPYIAPNFMSQRIKFLNDLKRLME